MTDMSNRALWAMRALPTSMGCSSCQTVRKSGAFTVSLGRMPWTRTLPHSYLFPGGLMSRWVVATTSNPTTNAKPTEQALLGFPLAVSKSMATKSTCSLAGRGSACKLH